MSLDLDKVLLTSTVPAFVEVSRGSFTLSTTARTIAPAASTTFTSTTPVDTTTGAIRLSVSSDNVVSDLFTSYLVNERISVPPAGVKGSSPYITNTASVSGSPSVLSLTTDNEYALTPTSISVTMKIENPYAGTATLSATTFTFRYSIFAPTYIV